jgi:hypothetical protein
MQPLCNPLAVAPIDPEPHPSPSRPSPDPPPRAMAGQGDHQAGQRSLGCLVPEGREHGGMRFRGQNNTSGVSGVHPVGLLALMTACVLTVEPKVGTAQHHVRRRRQDDLREGTSICRRMPIFDSGDALTPDRDGALAASAVSSDDRKRGWSSALSPANPPQADTASADVPSHDGSAEASRSPLSCGCVCDNAQSTERQSVCAEIV